MRAFTARQLTVLLTLVIGAVVAVCAFLVTGPDDLPRTAQVLAMGGAAMLASYPLLNYGLDRFIQGRIRGIYKTVQGLRGPSEAPVSVGPGEDVLGRVEGEVAEWASARRSEITELKEREKFRREFIGNLAHELKTPIFNIQGYILTLLEGGLEDEKVNRDFLTRASHGVDRLIKIVEDLDLITKLESGVMDLRLHRIPLREVVEEALEDVELQAREKGITLVDKVPDELMVLGDKDRLIQVFVNLFVNGVNYGRPGGHCVVSVDDLDERVLVEVSDNGIGISEEHLPRLFERFYRVGKSRSRNEGGSGLGLAIVKHIVDAHGQSITVKSEEGRGSTFAFTLRKAR
ncbi:MAG TPA: ATP-binding protein [Flavobacteriales bacterium]|mgnify:CR=1 FL=1|nr:ATP-binding protein [Flavobacteriales bacterium]HMR28325.1 ATP-binding protein [Flavobacteriales bacterium]